MASRRRGCTMDLRRGGRATDGPTRRGGPGMPDATTSRHASSGQPSFLAGSSRSRTLIGTVGLLLTCAIVVASCANAPVWGASVGAAGDPDGGPPANASGDALTPAQVGDAVLCVVNRQRGSRR